MGLSAFNAMRARMKAQEKAMEKPIAENPEPEKEVVSETIVETPEVEEIKGEEIENPDTTEELVASDSEDKVEETKPRKTDAEKLKKKKD